MNFPKLSQHRLRGRHLLIFITLILLTLGAIRFNEQLSSLFTPLHYVVGPTRAYSKASECFFDYVSYESIEGICGTYLQGFPFNKTHALFQSSVGLFADEDMFYALPLYIGQSSYAAKKYGIKINRQTGKVYDRISKQWNTYGYISESPDTISSRLTQQMRLGDMLIQIGRPLSVIYTRDGMVILDYDTKGGIIHVICLNGFFSKVVFYDSKTAIRI